ncbi:MAG: hypothetical protein U0175_10140 [Caldilineaceae bacterium]
MSVHNEALEMKNKPLEKDAPELEYQAITQDSLSMFLAAIGGAILGMLLTLLVLAIINGGTLSFSGGERLTTFEAKLQRVDANVDTVSKNLDVVATQSQNIATQLSTVEGNLRNELSKQDGDISNLSASIATLETTRQQFDAFTKALSEALAGMQSK